MKKNIKYLLLLFLCMFIGIGSVKAASIGVSSQNVKVTGEVTVTIGNLVSGVTYSLDTTNNDFATYFDVNNNTCGNRTNITSTCELKISPKDTLSLTSDKQIQLNLTPSSNDDIKTATLTIKANATTTTTKAPTTTTVASNKSNNANIKSITVKGDDDSDVVLTPEFSSSVYEYSATVEGKVSKVNIEAVLEDTKANLVISDNANQELVEGENNKITLTVTAEDGSQKAYILNIMRSALESNALLGDLKIKEYPNFKFSEDKFKYTVIIDEDVTSLSISYIVNSEKTVVDITGNEELKDGSIVRLLATAEDGTKKEYTLNISKIKNVTTTAVKEEKNPIVIIVLSIIGVALITSIIIVAVKKY